jgi:hypothetical protein
MCCHAAFRPPEEALELIDRWHWLKNLGTPDPNVELMGRLIAGPLLDRGNGALTPDGVARGRRRHARGRLLALHGSDQRRSPTAIGRHFGFERGLETEDLVEEADQLLSEPR